MLCRNLNGMGNNTTASPIKNTWKTRSNRRIGVFFAPLISIGFSFLAIHFFRRPASWTGAMLLPLFCFFVGGEDEVPRRRHCIRHFGWLHTQRFDQDPLKTRFEIRFTERMAAMLLKNFTRKVMKTPAQQQVRTLASCWRAEGGVAKKGEYPPL